MPLTVAIPVPVLFTVTLPSGFTILVDPPPVIVRVLPVSKPVTFTGLVPVLFRARLPIGVTTLVAPVPLPVLFNEAPSVKPVILITPRPSLSAVTLL